MNDNDPSFYAMSKTIAFLVFDRFQILDATGPMAAFEMPMQVLQPVPYGLRFVSARGGHHHQLIRGGSDHGAV